MYHRYQPHRILECPVLSDDCLHNMEQIQTVSGMQASIFLSVLHIYDILYDLLPSPSESARTVQASEGSQVPFITFMLVECLEKIQF